MLPAPISVIFISRPPYYYYTGNLEGETNKNGKMLINILEY